MEEAPAARHLKTARLGGAGDRAGRALLDEERRVELAAPREVDRRARQAGEPPDLVGGQVLEGAEPAPVSEAISRRACLSVAMGVPRTTTRGSVCLGSGAGSATDERAPCSTRAPPFSTT
jgi:hypothetical protein